LKETFSLSGSFNISFKNVLSHGFSQCIYPLPLPHPLGESLSVPWRKRSVSPSSPE